MAKKEPAVRFVIALFNRNGTALLRRGTIPNELWCDRDDRAVEAIVCTVASHNKLLLAETDTELYPNGTRDHFSWLILSSHEHDEFEQYWRAARSLLIDEAEWEDAWERAAKDFPPREDTWARLARMQKENRPNILTTIAETLGD